MSKKSIEKEKPFTPKKGGLILKIGPSYEVLTKPEELCTIDFRQQQINARPSTVGYFGKTYCSVHTELYEILGPERYREYFTEKAKQETTKLIRKKG